LIRVVDRAPITAAASSGANPASPSICGCSRQRFAKSSWTETADSPRDAARLSITGSGALNLDRRQSRLRLLPGCCRVSKNGVADVTVQACSPVDSFMFSDNGFR